LTIYRHISANKSSAPPRILSLEDDLDFFYLIERHLRGAGIDCALLHARNRPEFERIIRDETLDLIVADYMLPGFDGLTALRMAREQRPHLPFIFLSGTIGDDIGVSSLRLGAADYLRKENLSRLATSIRRVLHDAELTRQSREAEAKIREQARLLDLAQDAILVRDLDDRVEYWNRGAERLYGWTVSEALGSKTTELFDPGDSAFLEAKARLLQTGEWSGELRQISKTGAEITTASRWNLVRDESGRPRSILAIATDITSRRQLEAQVRHAQKMESIGQLAGGIAHDFNNILTAVIAFATMAKESVPERPDVQADLAEVHKAALRGRDLVQQILVFSRRQEQVRQPVRIQPILKETIRLLRSTFPANIEITTDIDESAPKVNADPTQMYQLLMNLAANANHEMRERGGVLGIAFAAARLDEEMARKHVGLAPGSFVVLSVSDTGEGLRPEKLERVFDPFFTARSPEAASNLGLSVAHGIATGHGGAIEAKSAPDRGTSFQVWLPALPEPETKSPLPAGSDLPLGSGQRILVVDDEEANCVAARRMLARLGYNAIAFSAPIEALAAYRAAPGNFDLVLADQGMPKMSGIELAVEIRRAGPGVPFILCTGYDDTELRERAWAAGVRHILAKPYTLQNLAELLRFLLDKAGR
jgi:PAS domain S-box-containing protein